MSRTTIAANKRSSTYIISRVTIALALVLDFCQTRRRSEHRNSQKLRLGSLRDFRNATSNNNGALRMTSQNVFLVWTCFGDGVDMFQNIGYTFIFCCTTRPIGLESDLLGMSDNLVGQRRTYRIVDWVGCHIRNQFLEFCNQRTSSGAISSSLRCSSRCCHNQ
jgi:hypothetical protein